MKPCPACGKENTDDVQYCEDCGRELPDKVETAEETVVETAIESDAVAEVVEEAEEVAAEDPEEEEVAVSEDETVVAEAEEVAAEDPEEELTDEIGLADDEDDGETHTAEPHLVVVSTGDKILLTKQEMIIGREDPISSIFPDIDTTPFGGLEGGVSRKHARMYEENGAYYIEDLNSTNYTLINKQKIDPSSARPLAAGDEIRLGRVALLFML